MNEYSKELIYRLRNDPRMDEHFGMLSWSGKRTCGSIGCIGGTAIAMYAAKNNLKIGPDLGLAMLQDGVPHPQHILDLHGPHADVLFFPDKWRQAVVNDTLAITGGDNERPSLETVQEMKEWAAGIKDGLGWVSGITAPQAANALEFHIERHPGYVDWREACLA